MMTSLPIILFVTIDIYEKVKIQRYKCIRFFFTIAFNQANDVYVNIYETAQLTMFYVYQKRNIHVNFANVLWVAFSIPSGSLSHVKYPV
jgi:hypothetical protein